MYLKHSAVKLLLTISSRAKKTHQTQFVVIEAVCVQGLFYSVWPSVRIQLPASICVGFEHKTRHCQYKLAQASQEQWQTGLSSYQQSIEWNFLQRSILYNFGIVLLYRLKLLRLVLSALLYFLPLQFASADLRISFWLWKDPENTHGVHRKQSKNCSYFGPCIYFGFVHSAKQSYLLNLLKLAFLPLHLSGCA